MSSKKPTVTEKIWLIRTFDIYKSIFKKNARRIPSSSDDLTLAIITSDVNGRNTTIRNTTKILFLVKKSFFSISKRFFFSTHLYTTNNHLHTSLCLLQLRISRKRRYIVLHRVRHDSRIFYWSPKWGLHPEVFQSWKDGLPWCPELPSRESNNLRYGTTTTNNTFIIHSWNISEIKK